MRFGLRFYFLPWFGRNRLLNLHNLLLDNLPDVRFVYEKAGRCNDGIHRRCNNPNNDQTGGDEKGNLGATRPSQEFSG